ncbi:MAG: molybdopterin-dependent oxidoreductase [Chloroflexi bacterium]|nr:molybdopterin-dependent oxidoreductase [Chloroflexota bacterium]
MADNLVIGEPLPYLEGVSKATGETKFTADVAIPGLLYGKILRSPHLHARILNVDYGKAERLIGVKGVMAGKDTPGRKFGVPRYPGARVDQQGLATERVRYVGDEVAAVAAVDFDTAEEALDLIRVDYEILPAVLDPEEAMKPGASRLHDHSPDNVSARQKWHFGDIVKAFAESDYIREDRFTTTSVQHCALEPHTCVASWDVSGRVTLWASCAAPYVCRAQLALTLDLAESKIRILSPYIGGHFGSKTPMFSHYFCAALLSRKTGRPVKFAHTREEVFGATLRRHPMSIWLKTGVKRDGTLLGSDCKLIADGGAYVSTGANALLLAGTFLTVTYRLPNVRYEACRVYTNKTISGPMRGFGAPQIRFAAEAQLEYICRDLGLDPVEVRLKNAIHAGDEMPNKFVINSCGLTECIEKVAAASGFKEKHDKMPDGRGIGLACSSFISGHSILLHAPSGAILKFDEDGGITLLTGVSNVGQGSDTAMGQIAAEELGICLEDVRVVSGDTDLCPVHAGSYSSRGTLWGGSAVKAAAQDAKRQLLEVVAEKLECSPEDLQVGNRRIWVKGSPGKGMSLAEAVTASMLGKGNPIMGRGYFKIESLMNAESGEGNLSPAYSFGAQAAEVAVDRDTGQVKVLNMWVAHDPGVAINRMSIEGQLHGSVQMGQGQALTEELIAEDGRWMNASFLDYRMPTAVDVPHTDSMLVETYDPTVPVGAKEAGEGTQISTVPAIVNALYDVVGVRFTDLPITPEKILAALEARDKA